MGIDVGLNQERAWTPDVAAGGVDLPVEQVAAVHAALAEQFSLPEILRIERIEPATWPAAELAWKPRIAREPDTFARYQDALEAHEDRLARPIEPLEHDLESWMCFLRRYAADAAPFELLTRLGLGFNDLGRLQRTWARKMKAKPPLERQAQKLGAKLDARVKRGEKLPVGSVKVGERALVASGLGRGAEPGASGVVDSTVKRGMVPEAVLDLAAYARLEAELEAAPAARVAILAAHGLSLPQAEAVEAAWHQRLDADRRLAADFRALRGHFARSAELGKRPLDRRDSTPTPAPAFVPTSAPAFVPAPAAAVAFLPFRPAAEPTAPGAAEAAPRRRAPGLDATLDLGERVRRSATLPFKKVSPPGPPAAPTLTATEPLRSVAELASFLAELTAFPERADDIRRRHGLRDGAAQALLEQRWRERFTREPALLPEYTERYRAELARLTRHPR